MTDTKHIRILCVDDHSVVREGLCMILNKNPDMEVVAEAADGREAVERFRQYRPDITLIDLQLPNMNGFDAIHAMRVVDPDARIIVLTMYKGYADTSRALQAGAAACLSKSALAAHIVQAVRDVHATGHLEGVAIIPANAKGVGLSAREAEVIKLVAEGWRDKEIAHRLGISEETVGTYTK